MMDEKRANAIINSLGVIEVTHQGKSVWIEQVENDFAQVHYLDSRERSRVPVRELVEG